MSSFRVFRLSSFLRSDFPVFCFHTFSSFPFSDFWVFGFCDLRASWFCDVRCFWFSDFWVFAFCDLGVSWFCDVRFFWFPDGLAWDFQTFKLPGSQTFEFSGFRTCEPRRCPANGSCVGVSSGTDGVRRHAHNHLLLLVRALFLSLRVARVLNRARFLQSLRLRRHIATTRRSKNDVATTINLAEQV